MWLLNTLLAERVHVALLQETKLTAQHANQAVQFFENHFELRYVNAISHSAGTAVLIKKKSGITVFPEWETDRSGRICALDVLYHNEAIRIVAAHVPNQPTERKGFFHQLRQYIDQCPIS